MLKHLWSSYGHDILTYSTSASAFSAVRMTRTIVLINNSTANAASWASAEIALWSYVSSPQLSPCILECPTTTHQLNIESPMLIRHLPYRQGEMYAAIICACLPSTRAFCRHFYPAWKQLVTPNASKADNCSQPTHVESEKWPGTKDVEANHPQENTGDEITPVVKQGGGGEKGEWKPPENPWYWMGLKGKNLGRVSVK